MSAIETFKVFTEAIYAHDVGAITALPAEDHLFVDSLGNRVHDARRMQTGWKAYFAMCPDYWINTDQVIADGETVLASGAAGGTINGIEWSTPAAWTAILRDGKVVEWRVFADSKRVYEMLAKR